MIVVYAISLFVPFVPFALFAIAIMKSRLGLEDLLASLECFLSCA